jgi:HSP20 family protein
MARETTRQTKEHTTQQSRSGAGNAKTGGQTNRAQTGRNAGATQSKADSQRETADRERSIQTQREGGGAQRQRESNQGQQQQRQQQRVPNLYRAAAQLPRNINATDPFTRMRRMAEDMDRLFQELGFGRSTMPSLLGSSAGFDMDRSSGNQSMNTLWSPQIETFRRGDKIVVRADLPGLKKEDVNVEVENDVLTISGERREENEEDREGFYRSERSYGQFYRTVPLPEGANADQCEATFENGVLEVSLTAPKNEQRRKQIQIR